MYYGAVSEDPTLVSSWRPLRLIQQEMDDEIARVYAENGIEGLKTSWVMELLRLHYSGPMTITELAESVQRTHSAMSQKVTAMRAAGWVRTTTGADARSKKIELTAKATEIVGLLAAEWRATEAAVAEIETELPFSITDYVAALEQARRRMSFHDRIVERLAADPAWTDRPASQPTAAGSRLPPPVPDSCRPFPTPPPVPDSRAGSRLPPTGSRFTT
jgi:DNA-binding MarR family transcriptional regulator